MRFKILGILLGIIVLIGCTKIDEIRFGDKRPITVVESDMTVMSPDAVLQSTGEILTVFRQGSGPTTLDGVIMKTVSTDGGVSWAQPDTIVATSWDCRTPSVTQLRDGLIIVTFTQSRTDERGAGILPVGCFTARSFDSGQTFTAPRMINMREFFWTAVSDELVELDDGTLLLPIYGQKDDSSSVGVYTVRSTDSGEMWETPAPVALDMDGIKSFEHATVIQVPDGRVLCMADVPGGEGFLIQSESEDGGQTWSKFRNTTIHGQSPDLLLTSQGTVICTFSDHWPNGISQIHSFDWGVTWEQEISLADLTISSTQPSVLSLGSDRLLTLYDRQVEMDKNRIQGLLMTSAPPKVPVGFSGSYRSGSGVHLRWNKVESASYYIIYRNIIADFEPSPGFPFSGNGIASPTLNVYTDTAVDTGQTYYYRVAAVRGTGKLLEGTGSLGEATETIQVDVR